MTLSPLDRWITDNRLPGILLKISMGNCRPASAMCPFSTRVISLPMADGPPIASHILGDNLIDLRRIGRNVGLFSWSTFSQVGEVSASTISGVVTGRVYPRWHE